MFHSYQVTLEPEIPNGAQGVFHQMVCYASTFSNLMNNPAFKQVHIVNLLGQLEIGDATIIVYSFL